MRAARRWIGIATGAVVLGVLVIGRRLQATPDGVYEPPPPAEVLARAPLRFEEVSASVGMTHRHEPWFPHPGAGSYLPLMALPPAIAVADVDGDGRMDVYVVEPRPGRANRLFRNQDGAHFVDVAAELGLDDLARTQGDSMALFADLDGDGRLDLFQSRFGCHAVFARPPGEARFVERPGAVERCSNPKAVNVADLDGDGFLDVVLGNYYPDVDLATYLPVNHVFGFAGANFQGGSPDILLGGPGGLRPAPDALAREVRASRGHTTAVGISDVDGDGRPDLFLSNDYTYDRLFLDRGGKRFVDATEAWIPRREHGFSGMNGDFGDFDDDGRMDLFVSNGFVPPFVPVRNVLWHHRGDHFENEATARGVGRCGWAWTAKFADFDDDGRLDLFVINGKARGALATRDTAARSFAFVRNTIATLPVEVRWDLALYPDFSRFVLGAFQRDCAFWNAGDRFWDVAPSAGLTDLEEGQAAALIDYDDDGRVDVVVGNVGGPLLLHHNVSRAGAWVGLELVGRGGARPPFGAKVWLRRPDGRRPMRELFPANGYRGQNDPRIVYGLGELAAVPDVEVRWPDGRQELFRGLRRDAYQQVRWGEGSAP